MHQIISKFEFQKKLLSNGKRMQNYRIQRLIGAPVRDLVSTKPDANKLMCPNTTIIRKYMPALGHLVSLPVPCGRCMYCKHKYQNKLIFRMYQHSRIYKNVLYVTLTYSDAHYTDDPVSLRSDISKFIKRFRKEFQDRTFSYYMVCERGDLFDRYHFHLLIFWNGFASKDYVCNLVRSKWFAPVRNLSSLSDLFDGLDDKAIIPYTPIGHVYIDRCENSGVTNSVSTAVLAYVSKYLSDGTKKIAFRSWSQHLGFDILSCDKDLYNKMRYLRCIEYMPADKVYNVAIPEYYKNKLFTQSERDVYFAEFLISDDYINYTDIINDPHKRLSILDNYERYAERCRNAYELRLRQKKRKYLSSINN